MENLNDNSYEAMEVDEYEQEISPEQFQIELEIPVDLEFLTGINNTEITDNEDDDNRKNVNKYKREDGDRDSSTETVTSETAHASNIHDLIFRLKCIKCKTDRSTVDDLRNHMEMKHNVFDEEVNSVCKICYSENEDRSYPEQVTIGRNDGHICTICKERFSGAHELIDHIKERHTDNDFKCYFCRMTFQSPDDLKEHKSDKHSFACTQCKIHCSNYADYRKHMNVHFRENNSSDQAKLQDEYAILFQSLMERASR